MPERQMQRAQELLRVLRISSFSLTPLGCVFSGPPGDHTNNRLKFPRFLAAPVLSCPVWVRLLLSALPFWPWGVGPPSLPSGVAAEFEAYPRLRFQGTFYIPDEMLPVKLPTGNRTKVLFTQRPSISKQQKTGLFSRLIFTVKHQFFSGSLQ